MITILYIVGFLLLFHGVYQLLKYLVVISEVKKKFHTISAQIAIRKAHGFFVLVPVLHEEKTIEKFLGDLSLQNYPKSSFEVYVITTQKEYLKSESVQPNTIDILNRLMADKKFPELQLTIIHYPDTEGFKAHQLDYAFKQIRKMRGDNAVSDAFFLFLDADSEIEPSTLARFNSSIEENIEIYQQPLLWFKNVEEIKSPFMQSFAFSQSFFSISYEVPMFIGKFFPWRLKYLVGHGLCTKGSFLLRIGGLPDIIEDVRLGRLSSFLNIKVKLVSGFGVVETAKNVLVYLKQSSVWFFGCGLFVCDYLYARSLRRTKDVNIRDFILLSYGFFKAFRWLNKGPFHLIGLILSITYVSIPLFALFFSSLLLNSLIPVLFVSKDFKYVWRKKFNNRSATIMLFRGVLFSPILYMLNFVGLYYGVFKLLKFYLWGQITLPKTER